MSTELVKTEPPEELPALIPADVFAKRRQMQSFLPDDGEASHMRAQAVVTGEIKTNWKHAVGEQVVAVGLTVFTRRVSKDGEPTKYGVYLALHCQDGRDLVTAGSGPMEDLPLIADKFGKPPWPHGVPVILTKVETGGGRTRLGLYPGIVDLKAS